MDYILVVLSEVTWLSMDVVPVKGAFFLQNNWSRRPPASKTFFVNFEF